jgi:3-hydroxy-9,10-secoandrosta-1,3,5(10)-triene-9,17-dione monooxygenase
MTTGALSAINTDDVFRVLSPVNERLGTLHTQAAEALRDSGVTRMLQPEEYGGIATHPRDFAEMVIDIARRDGSAGWIAGTVGVSPWELSMADRRVRDEVWEADPDTWVASAYQPTGAARPVTGGYRLTGRWQFASGVDHCEWVLLAAQQADGRVMHAVVPRADVQIVDDSWNGVGLRGTGSKDVVVSDVFVPSYRILDHHDVEHGVAAARAGIRNPVYHLPFSTVCPLGITAAVVGMAEGALAHQLAHDADDSTEHAAADIRASRLALLDTVSEFFHLVLDGEPIDSAARARSRRDQVHAARRAVRAVDDIVAMSGREAMRSDSPLQRFWRDAHMGLAHVVQPPVGAHPPAVQRPASAHTRAARRWATPAARIVSLH